MSNSTTVRRVDLEVEAKANVSGGLAQVKSEIRRAFEDVNRETAARIDTNKAVVTTAQQGAVAIGDQIKAAGAVADLGGVKKLGEMIAKITDPAGVGDIRKGADQERVKIAKDLSDVYKESLAVSQQVAIADTARTTAMLERTAAAAEFRREIERVNAAEQQQLSNAAARSPERREIWTNAQENRQVAARQYAEIVERTHRVEVAAAATDEQRKKAIGARTVALAQYAAQMKAVAEREAADIKMARGESRIASVAGAVGGVLAVIKVAGALAGAFDKASEKFEKGMVKGGTDFAWEVGKGLPIVGGILADIEETRNVLFGVNAELRAATAETEKNEKAVKQIQAAHKAVLDVSKEMRALNETPTDRINREAAERLKSIEENRKASIAAGAKAGSEDLRKLDEAERQVRIKQSNDIAEVEQKASDDRLAKRQQHAEAIFQSERAIADASTATVVASLKEAGREVDAQLAELQASTVAKLDDIQRRRDQLTTSDVDGPEKVRQSEALSREAQAIRDAAAAERARIQRQGAADREARSFETTAEVTRLQIDQYEALADAGNRQAAAEARKLEIRQKYAEEERKIAELLKRSDLAESERSRLKTMQATAKQRELAEIKRAAREAAAEVQKTAMIEAGETDISVFWARQDDEQRQVEAMVRDSASGLDIGPPSSTGAGTPTAQQIAEAIGAELSAGITESNGDLLDVITSLRDTLAQFVQRIGAGGDLAVLKIRR